MTDTSNSEKWLDRVMGLIAKAESTDSSGEAEAFMAKAQELIAKHNIDEAELARRGQAVDGGEMGKEDIDIPAPYASAKAGLLANIALPNGVVVLRSRREGVYSIIGTQADRDLVKVMFASLSTFAARSAMAAEVPEWDTPRRFRHSFVLAFGQRVGQRLEEANNHAAEESAVPGAGLVPVNKVRASNDWVKENVGPTRKGKVSSSSRAGHNAGRAAADRANLSRGVSSGGQRALGA